MYVYKNIKPIHRHIHEKFLYFQALFDIFCQCFWTFVPFNRYLLTGGLVCCWI